MAARRLHLLAIVAVTAAATTIPQKRPTLDSAIDAIARDALQQPIAGLSIAIAQRRKPILARGYGRADLAKNVAVTPDTVFHIDSISKHIEAAAALKLVERGKLALDKDVRAYVPDAPTAGRAVTMRQLLSHTGGIFDFSTLPDADETREWTHAPVFGLMRGKPLDFTPGARWQYSNGGFYIAGVAIEHATAESYASYVKDALFQPLGLDTASLCTVHDTVPNLATGYVTSHGKLTAAPAATWSLPFAAGAICATASDLVRWELALESGRVISPADVRLMHTPTRLTDGTIVDYGLGTRIGSIDGHRVYGHTGGGNGFKTILQSFPDDEIVIAILANTETADVASVAARVARALLHIEPRDSVDLPVPPDESTAIAGTFDSAEGPIEISTCANRLCYRSPDGSLHGSLRRQAPFVYVVDGETRVTFARGAGQATWAFVYDAGFLSDAKWRVR